MDLVTRIKRCSNCGQLICSDRRVDEYLRKNQEAFQMFKENDIIMLDEDRFEELNEKYGYTFDDICPVCESTEFYHKLYCFDDPDGKPYFFYNPIPGDEFWAYNEEEKQKIAQIIREEDAHYVEPEYVKTVNECTHSVDSSHRITIDQNNVDIKKYIEGLLAIKAAEYSLENRLRDLLYSRYSLGQACKNVSCKAKNIGVKEANAQLIDTENRIKEITNAFSIPENWYVQCGIEKPIEPAKPGKFELVKPVEPQYSKPGLLNKKKVLSENEELKNKYEADLNNYNEKKRNYDNSIADYENKLIEYKKLNEQFLEREKEYKAEEYNKWYKNLLETNDDFRKLSESHEHYQWIVDNPDEYAKKQFENSYIKITNDWNESEIGKCIDVLKKAYQTESDYLSAGVYFPKYATFPAVSTIYEYFLSGRCSELTGPYGAYNIYENELRANTIIEKLDEISKKLDEIKRNQYTLFTAIQNINSQLSRLNSASEKMRKELKSGFSNVNDNLEILNHNTAVTAYNTEVTAFYTKKNAELTNALGFLVALK